MKHKPLLLLALFACSIIFTVHAQDYEGIPFFEDTCFVIPGDYMAPYLYDHGELDEVIFADGPATGGQFQRGDEYYAVFDEYLEGEKYIGWNGGAKKASRNLIGDVMGRLTINVMENDEYKLKVWKENIRSFNFYIYDYATVTVIDSLYIGPDNQIPTGDYPVQNGHEWYYGDSISLTAGEYILEFDHSGTNTGLGHFTLLPIEYDSNFVPELELDTHVVILDGDIDFTASADGEIFIVPAKTVVGDMGYDHPISFAQMYVTAVHSESVTQGANSSVAGGVGDFFIYLRDESGISSLGSFITIVDTTPPELTLADPDEDTILYGEEFEVVLNKYGYIVITNDTAKKSDDLFSIAYDVREAYADDTMGFPTYGIPIDSIPGSFLLFGIDPSGNVTDSIPVYIEEDNSAPVLTLVSNDSVITPNPFIASSDELGMIVLVSDTIPSDSVASLNMMEMDWFNTPEWLHSVSDVEAEDTVEIITMFITLEGHEVPDSFLLYAVDISGNVSDSIIVWLLDDETDPVLTLESGDTSVFQGEEIEVSANEDIVTFLLIFDDVTPEQILLANANGDEDFMDSVIVAELSMWDDPFFADEIYEMEIPDSVVPDTYSLYAVDFGLNFSNEILMTVLEAKPTLTLLSADSVVTPDEFEVESDMDGYVLLTNDTVTREYLMSLDIEEESDFYEEYFIYDFDEVEEEVTTTLSTEYAALYYKNAPDTFRLYAMSYNNKVSEPVEVFINTSDEIPVLTLIGTDSSFHFEDTIFVRVDKEVITISIMEEAITPTIFKDYVWALDFDFFDTIGYDEVSDDIVPNEDVFLVLDSTYLDPGVHYLYAIDHSFNFSNGIKVNVLEPVSLKDKLLNGISIYPNPSSTGFTVDLSSLTQSASLDIFNLSGQLIYSELVKVGEKHFIGKNNFTDKGMYLIRITSGNKSNTYKIITN